MRTLRDWCEALEIHAQLQTHKHVPLQLVWEEYREAHADGCSYIG
jgi:hypothetical protein